MSNTTYPCCDHTWVSHTGSDLPPAVLLETPPPWTGCWRIGIHMVAGQSQWISLPPGTSCPVCREVLDEKAPPVKRRTAISEHPAECYLHDSGNVDRRKCETAAVNCLLTCDAVRGPKLKKVVILAREVRPEERTIVPGSARIKDGEIVADWYTAGGDKRRAYTMTAAEARLLARDLEKAVDFAAGRLGTHTEGVDK